MVVSKRAILVIGLAALVAGCGEEQQQSQSQPQQQAPQQQAMDAAGAQQTAAAAEHPEADAATLRTGRELYLQNCAQCHGENAQGAPNWQKPGPDGKYPAPPLNGTGHAWHHPMPALRQTIAFGTKHIGGSMPAWKDELSGEQMNAIIYWFQSQWPDELYQAWEEMSARARQGG